MKDYLDKSVVFSANNVHSISERLITLMVHKTQYLWVNSYGKVEQDVM